MSAPKTNIAPEEVKQEAERHQTLKDFSFCALMDDMSKKEQKTETEGYTEERLQALKKEEIGLDALAMRKLGDDKEADPFTLEKIPSDFAKFANEVPDENCNPTLNAIAIQSAIAMVELAEQSPVIASDVGVKQSNPLFAALTTDPNLAQSHKTEWAKLTPQEQQSLQLVSTMISDEYKNSNMGIFFTKFWEGWVEKTKNAVEETEKMRAQNPELFNQQVEAAQQIHSQETSPLAPLGVSVGAGLTGMAITGQVLRNTPYIPAKLLGGAIGYFTGSAVGTAGYNATTGSNEKSFFERTGETAKEGFEAMKQGGTDLLKGAGFTKETAEKFGPALGGVGVAALIGLTIWAATSLGKDEKEGKGSEGGSFLKTAAVSLGLMFGIPLLYNLGKEALGKLNIVKQATDAMGNLWDDKSKSFEEWKAGFVKDHPDLKGFFDHVGLKELSILLGGTVSVGALLMFTKTNPLKLFSWLFSLRGVLSLAVIAGVATLLFGVNEVEAKDLFDKHGKEDENTFLNAAGKYFGFTTNSEGKSEKFDSKAFEGWWNTKKEKAVKWMKGDGKTRWRVECATLLEGVTADEVFTAAEVTAGATFGIIAVRALQKGKWGKFAGFGVSAAWLLGDALRRDGEKIPENETDPFSVIGENLKQKGEGILDVYRRYSFFGKKEAGAEESELLKAVKEAFSSETFHKIWGDMKKTDLAQNIIVGGEQFIIAALLLSAFKILASRFITLKGIQYTAILALLGISSFSYAEGTKGLSDFGEATGKIFGKCSEDFSTAMPQDMDPSTLEKICPSYIRDGLYSFGVNMPNSFIEAKYLPQISKGLDELYTKGQSYPVEGRNDFLITLEHVRDLQNTQKEEKEGKHFCIYQFSRLAALAQDTGKLVSVIYTPEKTYQISIDGVVFDGFEENPLLGLGIETEHERENEMTSYMVEGLDNLDWAIGRYANEADGITPEQQQPALDVVENIRKKISEKGYKSFVQADFDAINSALKSIHGHLERDENGIEIKVVFPKTSGEYAGLMPGVSQENFASHKAVLNKNMVESGVSGWATGWHHVIMDTAEDMLPHAPEGSDLREIILAMKTAPEKINNPVFLARFLKAVEKSGGENWGARLTNWGLTIWYGSKNITLETLSSTAEMVGHAFLSAEEGGGLDAFANKGGFALAVGFGGAARWADHLAKVNKAGIITRTITRSLRLVTWDVPMASFEIMGKIAQGGVQSTRIVQNPIIWAQNKAMNIGSAGAKWGGRGMGAIGKFPGLGKLEHFGQKTELRFLRSQYIQEAIKQEYWGGKAYEFPTARAEIEKITHKMKTLVERALKIEEELAGGTYHKSAETLGNEWNAILNRNTTYRYLSSIKGKVWDPTKLLTEPFRQIGNATRWVSSQAPRLSSGVQKVVQVVPKVAKAAPEILGGVGIAGRVLEGGIDGYRAWNASNEDLAKTRGEKAGLSFSLAGVGVAAWKKLGLLSKGNLAVAVGLAPWEMIARNALQSGERAHAKDEDYRSEYSPQGLLHNISLTTNESSTGDTYREFFGANDNKTQVREEMWKAVSFFQAAGIEPPISKEQLSEFQENYLFFIASQYQNFLPNDLFEANTLALKAGKYAHFLLEKKDFPVDKKQALVAEIMKEKTPELPQAGYRSSLHRGLAEVAHLFSFSGSPTMENLQKFFCPENREYFGIYFDPEDHCWKIYNVYTLSSDESFAGLDENDIWKQMSTYMRENYSTMFESEHDSIVDRPSMFVSDVLTMRRNLAEKSWGAITGGNDVRDIPKSIIGSFRGNVSETRKRSFARAQKITETFISGGEIFLESQRKLLSQRSAANDDNYALAA